MDWFPRIKMFLSRRKEVISHWYVPVENFQFSSADFYRRIEQELGERKVPGLKTTRIIMKEGGLHTSNREYLQLCRERLMFDICAAPFGTGYFFSFRLVERPIGTSLLEVILMCLAIGAVHLGVGMTIGINMANYAAPGALVLACLLAPIVRIPVFTAFYESFLRRETYYREDTRLMYLTTIETATKHVVEEVTAEHGVKLIKTYKRNPKGGQLFSECESKPDQLPQKSEQPETSVGM